ncbi:ferrochelatase [Psychrobium sp. 1_MG-2023]|uniref:ferrochelatase n=1 Tax=Psychrobium sp. 1_MG-2023 TaxID=3062624 RepID=UPI000C338B0E|nr:ferrochelatase [Psychrobium sp. 1_MG-2023]MDP2562326.1 ferrochelatase [Psychrobium sp. 1_MG-2023]PKF58064.1 ferrochelatase [Alteromonadales bacterium alter-6D02]
MKYIGKTNFQHSQQQKVGVLLTNLGTPKEPTRKALRVYLKEFLSDPRVVEAPRLLWWMVLNFVILTIRPSRSAKAYQTVWTEQGSPLLLHTKAQTEKVRAQLVETYGDNVVVEFAMRYGQPSISDTLDRMLEQGVTKLVVLPLYPQYSATTTASTFDAIAADFTKRRAIPELRFISHYHDKSAYIEALAQKVEQYWQEHGRADKLILSYHGIPKRYLMQGDPYHCECYKTSRLLGERLGLSSEEYQTTFQSRFGREEWLKPYTDHTLQALPQQGVKSIQVICPGFSADCLETIEEIGIENRDYFLEAGGERFEYIEALNSDDNHIDALVSIVEENLHGWTNHQHDAQTCLEQAKKFGAQR